MNAGIAGVVATASVASIAGAAGTAASTGNLEIVQFGVALVLNAALTFGVVAADERYLLTRHPDLLERAWPSSTRLAAAVAFGPLCLPIHFWRTSGGLLRRAVGLAAAVLVVVVVELVLVVLELVA